MNENIEYLRFFYRTVADGIVCGLTHPLEWAVNEHRTMIQINYYEQDKEHYVRFLYEMYCLYFMQAPTSSQQIFDWVNELYEKNPMCQGYFDFLKDEMDKFITKETLRRADLG